MDKPEHPRDSGLVASSFFALRSGLTAFLAAMLFLPFGIEVALMGERGIQVQVGNQS